jgi:hypothetical protein
MNGSDERTGRETRILLLVVAVAVLVLVVLARFRFPETELTAVAPTPGPLERLAVRSNYDDLGRTIALIVDRLGSAVVVLRLESTLPPAPHVGSRVIEPPPPVAPPVRLVAGVRVRPDLVLALLPANTRVITDTPPAATDAKRGLVLVRVPVAGSAGRVPEPLDGFAGFRYVAVVEPAIGGPTARPVFIGRIDATTDPVWPAAPFVLGGDMNVPAGALLFALDGRFIGWIAQTPAGPAIVPPATLDLVVRELIGSAQPNEDDAPGA